jgi:tRNA(Ile)-lysidine synthase
VPDIDEGVGLLRFARNDEFLRALEQLVPEGRLGLAVSGGPDSLALLLLAAAARPDAVEAATVDHGLRPESAREAALVAEVCRKLSVPHTILAVAVKQDASLQAQAREARYAALAGWAEQKGLAAVATAHHADDQAETLLMRLARGSGLAGLAGVRHDRPLTAQVRLIRPLLDWRKDELAAVVAAAEVPYVDDPSNHDERHDRSRVRAYLKQAEWLDAARLARSAKALAEADDALVWSARRLAEERVHRDGTDIRIEAGHLPAELQRRLLVMELERLGAGAARGPDIDRALGTLRSGGTCTLAGVKLSGGAVWRLAPAPQRRS